MKPSSLSNRLRLLASRIHHQTPLDARESQKLLTVLTKSFREHLDEVHPLSISDHGTRTSTAAASSAAVKGSRSHGSLALTDEHLANVLTSPLFVEDGRSRSAESSYENAKLELKTEYNADPVKLLERYAAKGCATVVIAQLCLKSFAKINREAPDTEQQMKYAAMRPGSRVLLWLLNSSHHDQDLYQQKLSFLNLLVETLCREGQERLVWKWLKLPGTTSPIQNSQQESSPSDPADANAIPQWKGILLSCLVRHKLQIDGSSLTDALTAFFHARSLKRKANADDPMRRIRLSSAYAEISTVLRAKPERICSTSAAQIDKLLDYLGRLKETWHVRIDRDLMHLHHPLSPDVSPIYSTLRSLFSDSSLERSMFIEYFFHVSTPTESSSKYALLLDIASRLHLQGRIEESQWVVSRIRILYSEKSEDLAIAMQKWPRMKKEEVGRSSSTEFYVLFNDARPQFAL